MIRKVSRSEIRTTHVTGMVTDINRTGQVVCGQWPRATQHKPPVFADRGG